MTKLIELAHASDMSYLEFAKEVVSECLVLGQRHYDDKGYPLEVLFKDPIRGKFLKLAITEVTTEEANTLVQIQSLQGD